jgi:polysaccharide export outer membrane protein
MMRRACALVVMAALAAAAGTVAFAQGPVPAVEPPAHYVIGPDDVLSIVFWRDKDMSADVVVRPDGKISLPLLNDIQAGGLTPAELRDAVHTEALRFVEEPTVTVIVKQIKSRKLFITGQVDKPGSYALGGPTTVLQLIAMAGGLKEFADGGHILITRTDTASRRQVGFRFNYEQVLSGKNLQQNIELKPGDTVIVP